MIEGIFTLTILAFGIVGVLTLFQQNVDRSDLSEAQTLALGLAQERLEQVVQNKAINGYETIIEANYPPFEDLAAEGYPGYTRLLTILEVKGTDLITPTPVSGYKRLTVTVVMPGGEKMTLETLITAWGPQQ